MGDSSFDYEGAVNSGYSDEEILDHLVKSHPDFDVNGAFSSGYSSKEINEHLSSRKKPEPKEERNALQKGARIVGQYGLGIAEGSVPGIVYDIGVSPVNSKSYLTNLHSEDLGRDIEFLYEKNEGKPFEEWSDQDKEFYNHTSELIKNPNKIAEKSNPIDLSIRGIAQKFTGVDLEPEDIAEEAAHWAGFIKDPKKLFELTKTGLNKKDLLKAIAPTGTEALRGLGAGTALQFAKQGAFGPIGTLAAMVFGDLAGGGVSAVLKGGKKLLTNPREVLAEVASKFTRKDKIDLQKDIIKDFRDTNVQPDIGTITNSDLVKWIQSRLAQSGLTGKALDELKETITSEVKEEYKAIADSVGNATSATTHEVGEVTKGFLKEIREADEAVHQQLYKNAGKALKPKASVNSSKLYKSVEELEAKLKPGKNKSAEQKIVLNELEKLKKDIYDASNGLKFSDVKNLLNDKLGIQDVINYEAQGGAKKLLKEIVGEIDRTIISHGKDNPTFAKNYVEANQKFSQHAKEFRNKRVKQFFSDNDPAQILNKMNSVQGIRDLENLLKKSPKGIDALNDLKRFKLDRMISDHMIDSTTNQLKYGTFSKLLEKGKNRELAKELLPKKSFKRLERLQRNSGKLAETAQKFLNSSKTGVTLEDAGVVAKVLSDLGNVLIGNPFPLVKTGAGIAGTRYLTKLIGDPSFLKLVEEMILATDKNGITLMTKIGEQLLETINASLVETAKESSRGSNRKEKL